LSGTRPPALKIKRTGGTPIPQNNQNHPAIMQRLFTYCTPAKQICPTTWAWLNC
jgi:hypothetical protein